MIISLQSYHRRFGLRKKKIKDAFSKKVCHMPTRHVKKEREKMHTQRRYAICPQGMSKKRERRKERKDSPYPRKIKEREESYKGVHPPSSKNIHTLEHLDQGL
jgi:hypothetical protein